MNEKQIILLKSIAKLLMEEAYEAGHQFTYPSKIDRDKWIYMRIDYIFKRSGIMEKKGDK